MAGRLFLDTGPSDDAIERFVAAMAALEQNTPLGGPASYNNASLTVAGRVMVGAPG